MSAERRVSIVIDTTGNPAGINTIIDRFGEMEGSADRLFSALQAGVAIDIGGKLVSGLAQIPAAFERAVQRGVQFNATLQTAELGIAAILRQFDKTGQFKSFDDAMAASAEAIELLKQKAKESPATFQELVSAFQGTAGAMAAANIPLQDQVNLIVNMSQALSGLGIQSSQILQETRALITGNINADAAAAKILGITSADITAAKAQGQLYQFLTGKISAFAEAGARGATTMNAALSNLEDTIDDVLATVTKPIFEGMTKGTLDLSKAISDPKTVKGLQTLGFEIANLVKAGYELTTWAVENQSLLIFLARAAMAYGAAMAAIKIGGLLTDLGRKTAALFAGKTALDAETSALGRNTIAQAANARARTSSVRAGGFRDVASTYSDMSVGQLRRQAIGPAGSRLAGTGAALAGAGAAAVAAIPTIATSALIAYTVGEMISQGLIARGQARDGRLTDATDAVVTENNKLNNSTQNFANEKEQVALMREITAARAAAAANLTSALASGNENLVRLYRNQVAALDLIFDRTRKVTAQEMARRTASRDLVKYLEDQASAMARLAPQVAEAAAVLEAAQFAALDPEEKLKRSKDERGQIAAGLVESEASFANAEGNPAEAEAARLEVIEAKLKLIDLDKEIAALEAKIAAEVQKSKDALDGVLAATEKALAARRDITSDIMIAEARARGEDEIADRLERQKRLREEIRRIVDATGVSEAEAERVARRLILAQEAAAKKGTKGASGRPVAPRSKGVETYDEANRRIAGGENYDETNRRMSGGRWTPLAMQTVPSFSSVVPSPAPAPTAAPKQPGGRTSNLEGTAAALERLKDDVEGAMGGEAEAQAMEALASLGKALVERLEAGDRRYALLAERYREMQTQLANGRTR